MSGLTFDVLTLTRFDVLQWFWYKVLYFHMYIKKERYIVQNGRSGRSRWNLVGAVGMWEDPKYKILASENHTFVRYRSNSSLKLRMAAVPDRDEIWWISWGEAVDQKYKILASGNHAFWIYRFYISDLVSHSTVSTKFCLDLPLGPFGTTIKEIK